MCDSDQSGFILPDKLKDILSTFCFPLSDEQFEDLLSDVRKYGNTINYHEFFTLYKKSHNEVSNYFHTFERFVSLDVQKSLCNL